MPAAPTAPANLSTATGCATCGALQRMPSQAGRWNLLRCAVCDNALLRRNGRSLDAALAFSAAGLLLLLPANLLPFLGTAIAGVSRESLLASSATAMVDNGFPELGIAVALFIVVLPPLRLALLTAVLGVLRFGRGRRPRWLGPAFRWAGTLKDWAMADVFLLGFAVAVARLRTEISTDIFIGGYCFIAAGLMTLLTRATLDEASVWAAIGPAAPPTPAAPAASAPTAPAVLADPPGAAPADSRPAIDCHACGLLLPATAAGGHCPRCAARVHARLPGSAARAMAFTVAAALLYIPANLYPMATLPVGLEPVEYTVLLGVIDLVHAGLWGLALLVLLASFVIPLLKLAGLAWCIASVLRRSQRRLRAKSRLFTVVAEIGRWSMVDPFVIACFVPITQYNALVYGRAEEAAPMFAAVVILTMLATHAFDPRTLWDASRDRSTA